MCCILGNIGPCCAHRNREKYGRSGTPTIRKANTGNVELPVPDDVDAQLLKARSLLIAKKFDEAKLIIEEVLKTDPDNEKARVIAECIQKHTEKSPTSRRQIRVQLLDDVEHSWQCSPNTPHMPILSEEKPILEESGLLQRLNEIVVPTIAFHNTPLTQTINALIGLSEQYDPQKRGMNMLVVLAPGIPEPTLTLSLKNMSLDKILNFIAKASAYQYDVEDDVIVFRKTENAVTEHLQTHFFKISRAAVVRMTGLAPEDPINQPSVAQEEQLIKAFFQKAGVHFSAGTNLAFDGAQLIVTQTPRNIKHVRDILAKYAETKQVEIEAKFIEVQQGVLDELQFGWNFSNNTPLNKHLQSISLSTSSGNQNNNLRTLNEAFNVKSASSSEGKIVIGNTSNAGGNAQELTIANPIPSLPGGANLGVMASDFAKITGVISGKLDLALTLRALEQHSGTDLMSAPKVTVLSGRTAKITVAKEFIYPKTYGAISSEVGTGDHDSAGVTITAGTPSDFETRNIGVEMTVTPIIEENGCISMRLEPRVTELEGFIEYGGRSVAIQGNTSVDVPPGFFQPIFSTRQIQTEVTIFDGATVVMGGLTREEVKEVHDKVPVLGDIPLLGKLFRSKGETSQKKNLLIFVTANILTPSGAPIRQQTQLTSETSDNHDN